MTFEKKGGGESLVIERSFFFFFQIQISEFGVGPKPTKRVIVNVCFLLFRFERRKMPQCMITCHLQHTVKHHECQCVLVVLEQRFHISSRVFTSGCLVCGAC